MATGNQGRDRRIEKMADIQKLYRKSPKQAMQQIKKDPPPLCCPILITEVHNYFEQMCAATPDNASPGPTPIWAWPSSDNSDVMEVEITQQEMRNVFKRLPTRHQAQTIFPIPLTKILETCRKNNCLEDIHHHSDPRN